MSALVSLHTPLWASASVRSRTDGAAFCVTRTNRDTVGNARRKLPSLPSSAIGGAWRMVLRSRVGRHDSSDSTSKPWR